MTKNGIVTIFVLICILYLLVSCASKPPDVVICAHVNDNQLYCNYTISDKPFYVDADTPFKDIDGKIYEVKDLINISLVVPPTSYGKIKAYIIDQCKKNSNCSNNIPKLNNFGATFERK
jgi:hypothetical protein